MRHKVRILGVYTVRWIPIKEQLDSHQVIKKIMENLVDLRV